MRDVLPEAIRIADDVTASLSRHLNRHHGLDGVVPDEDPRGYTENGAKHLRNHLPAAVLDRLTAWRRDPAAWLTVRNLPMPERPVPTPVTGFADETRLTAVNLVHFGMLDLLGLVPVAYRWENQGRLVRNVAPRPDAGGARTSWGFAAPLDWHTDDSILDHRSGADPETAIPHHLTFYGMRNDERVPTDLLPVADVLAALPHPVVDDLRRPEFTVTAPESYTAGADGRPLTREDVPLVWTLPGGRDAVRYGPGRISAGTARAERALARFEQCLGELEGTRVLLDAGDFHLFDNRRVLHRRVPFAPAAHGAARWLRRTYARTRDGG